MSPNGFQPPFINIKIEPAEAKIQGSEENVNRRRNTVKISEDNMKRNEYYTKKWGKQDKGRKQTKEVRIMW